MSHRRSWLVWGSVALVAILFAGWWRLQVLGERRLQEFERATDSLPDKALLMADDAAPHRLCRQELKARYALLYSRALDRCGVDLTHDSLIRPALAYYRLHGDLRYRMMALYYQGRISQNAGNHPRSHLHLAEAEQLADSLADHRFGALATQARSRLYNEEFNLPEELRYSERSYHHILQLGDMDYQLFALDDLANSLYNNERLEEADARYAELLTLAEQADEPYYRAEALTGQATISLQQGEPERAHRLFNRVRRELGAHHGVDWLTDYAYTCARLGMADSAAYYMTLAQKEASDEREELRILYRQYEIDRHLGDLEAAFAGHRTISRIQDSLTRAILSQSSIAAQRDLFEQEMLHISERLHQQALRVWRWGVVTVLLFLVVLSVSVWRSRSKSRAIERYMEQLALAREHLLHQEAELTDLGRRIAGQLKTRFEPMNRLAETYYAHLRSPKEQERIYRHVKEDLHAMGTPTYTREELEPLINGSLDGLMERMREQLPMLREEEFQLLCYLVVGFTYTSISIFTECRISTLYTRVSRLRDRISASSAPDRELFLKYLGR